MTRILIVLTLAILLLPAPHPGKPEAVRAGTLLVSARALPLDPSDPARRSIGALTYLGGWELQSANPGFGGISALLAAGPGEMLALSDSGILMGFHVGDGPHLRRPFIAPSSAGPASPLVGVGFRVADA